MPNVNSNSLHVYWLNWPKRPVVQRSIAKITRKNVNATAYMTNDQVEWLKRIGRKYWQFCDNFKCTHWCKTERNSERTSNDQRMFYLNIHNFLSFVRFIHRLFFAFPRIKLLTRQDLQTCQGVNMQWWFYWINIVFEKNKRMREVIDKREGERFSK